MLLFLFLYTHIFGADWLSVKGNKIIDENGNEVWLTGLNWFGYNTGFAALDGLCCAELESSLDGLFIYINNIYFFSNCGSWV
jgi:hypothetical protein